MRKKRIRAIPWIEIATMVSSSSHPRNPRNPRLKTPDPELNSFGDHELDEVGDAAAIAPFVVVPTHQFEEAFVQFDAGAGVENRGCFAVDEV